MDSAESDPDSPPDAAAPTIDISDEASPDQSNTQVSQIPLSLWPYILTDSTKAPDLTWSGNESSPSGSSISPPNVTHFSFSPTSSAPQLPNEPTPLFAPERNYDHIQGIANGILPPAATISALEAGAAAWALNGPPSIAYPRRQTGTYTEWVSKASGFVASVRPAN